MLFEQLPAIIRTQIEKVLHSGQVPRSPLFVFSEEQIGWNINYFADKLHFGFQDIFYSVKANSLSKIISILDNLGTGFEIASAFELDLLIEQQIEPHRIIFSNPVKIPHHIKQAADYGVCVFAFDTENELEKIKQNAPNSKVYLRIETNNSGSDWSLDKKFGASPEQVNKLFNQAKELNLCPAGITFHSGWNNKNANVWMQNFSDVTNLIRDCYMSGIRLEFINFGGGFPAHLVDQYTYLDEIADKIVPFINVLKNDFGLKLIVEPGSFVVSNAGVLLTQIYDIVERTNINWIFINSTITNGFFWILGGLHYDVVYPYFSKKQEKTKEFIVTGPTNDSKDIFGKYYLPENIKKGDFLLIYPAGGYSISAHQYNGFAMPEAYFF